MRDTMSDEDLQQHAEGIAPSQEQSATTSYGPFGWETTRSGAPIAETLGDGGFTPEDFEVQQQLGQLSWVTERPQDSPLQVTRAGSERLAILLFLATYYSRQAYTGAIRVLLKEFLPGASAVAVNEVQIMTRLHPLPQEPWRDARTPISSDTPFVPLLGHFRSAPSDAGRRVMTSIAEENNNSREPAVWLVYKWEGLQPLSHYAAAAQSAQEPGLFGRGVSALWGSRGGSSEEAASTALRSRCAMVRSIVRGAVAAVAYCHQRDVVHGSLGAGSLLLSTYEDLRWQEVIVKLDNFGFARQYPSAGSSAHPPVTQSPLFPGPLPLGTENPSALGQREDLQALGLVALELVFAALAEGSTATGPALQRLLMDVFASDTRAFRKYCLNEADWSVPTILLDEFDGAGWQLISDLITGSRSAKELEQNAFCCL